MSSRSIVFDVEADVSGFQRSMKRLSSSVKSTGQKVKRSLSPASAGTDRFNKSLIASKEIAEGFGGALGGTAGQVAKFSVGLSAAAGAAGGLGIAIGGVGIAAIASGAAIVKLAEVGISSTLALVDTAGKAIDEFGDAAEDLYGTAAVAQVQALTGAVDDLGAIWSGFAVKIVESATVSQREIDILVGAFDFLADSVVFLHGRMSEWYDFVQSLAPAAWVAQIGVGMDALASRGSAVSAALGEARIEASYDFSADFDRHTAAMERLERAATKTAKAVKSAQPDPLDAIQIGPATGVDRDLAGETATAIEDMNLDAVITSLDDIAAGSSAWDKLSEGAQKYGAQVAAIGSATTQVMGNIASLSRSAFDEQVRQLQEGEAIDTKFKRRKLKRTWAHYKAMKISEATVASFANAVALTIAFAPLGPLAPAAAAGVAGTQLAAQLALIAGEKMPAYARGGMIPDHTLASVQPGEGILTRRATANLGGEEGVRAMNQGAGSSWYAPIILDSRIIGRAVVQSLQGEAGRALDRRSRAIPGRIDPYGQ